MKKPTLPVLVKNSVIAQLIPPNSLLWPDAFDGLKADVVINWKHNAWTHDVLLKEQAELPLGWNAATTRLEILTEFIVDAEPDLQKNAAEIQPALVDHTVIDFGAQAILVGKAYSVNSATFNLAGALNPDLDGAAVRKQWHKTDDARHFLIESLDWPTASQSMRDLPLRRHASNSQNGRASVPTSPDLPPTPISTTLSLARIFPKTPPPLIDQKPIQLAAHDYKPTGYLIDFTTISSGGVSTFTSGTTYYVKNSYSIGTTVTVQANAILKFKNNAYLLVYGPLSFPSSGTKAVFTSRNDDSVGDIIQSVAGESNSDGDPSSNRANPALWIYYDQNNVTVRTTRFRWAKVGIKIDRNSGDTATQTITDCFFESITGTGSAGVSGNSYYTTISNLKKCKVDYPGPSMTLDCVGIENEWAGDTSWSLINPATAGWPTSSTSTTPEIEGFASATSVNAGSSISFYVDVRSGASTYTIDIYRMGWYNSVGGRKMTWYDAGSSSSVTSITRTGKKQSFITVNTSDGGVVDCLAGSTPWILGDSGGNYGYTLAVPSWWLSGVYLARIREATHGKDSYIIFTIREDGRGSDLYLQSSVTTWEAYNQWGGNSLYPYPFTADCNGTLHCPTCDPPDRFGTKVSFNRPYAGNACHTYLSYGTGAGEFFVQISNNGQPGWEYNAVRWIERQGYDVTYCTDVDTHTPSTNGTSLLNKSVKAFISVGHDEYWSPEMRANVEAARDRTSSPINLVFIAGNICFRVIHFETGLRAFTCDKYTGPINDEWRSMTNSPNHEATLTGMDWINGYSGAITVTNISGHWAFNHTGISTNSGQSLAGLGGYEVDGDYITNACDHIGFTSAHPSWGAGPYDTIKLADTRIPTTCGTNSECRTYTTIYTATNGPGTNSAFHAQVFATGSMQWCWGLDDYGYAAFFGTYTNPVARQMIHNVLRTFTGNPTSQLP